MSVDATCSTVLPSAAVTESFQLEEFTLRGQPGRNPHAAIAIDGERLSTAGNPLST